MRSRTTSLFLYLVLFSCANNSPYENIDFHEVDHANSHLEFYLINEKNHSNYYSFENLSKHLESQGKNMVFAVNGGMFKPSYQAVGLYIEKGKILSPLNIDEDEEGNFFLLPNGIYGIYENGSPFITPTKRFKSTEGVNFATQSGPMLVVDGKIHSKFKKESENLNIRNGVGILPNGNSIFAISNDEINFYDFAMFFKDAGCKDALYLDGYVSKMYLPEKELTEMGGKFGVIIAEYE